MRALTLERWALDPGADTADPSDPIPYSFTWTDTADPSDLRPYAFKWDTANPEEWDTAAPNWNAGFQGIAAGAGTGAAIGAAIGTVFPGIGNAIGGVVGGAVGAIGGFFAGLFGGKKGGEPPKPKPTPSWVVDVLEEGRRALQEVPPNPSKMLDATLVVSGKLTRESYTRAKLAGELPSQKYDRNRSAAQAKGRALDQKFAPQIAAHLKGLSPGEKALVSAAMPIGQGSVTLEALHAIRGHVDGAKRQRREPRQTIFSSEALERMQQQYVPQRPGADSRPRSPETPLEAAPPPPILTDERDDADAEQDWTETSGPSPYATAPTLEDLPKPLWHVSPSVMPRHIFERLLYTVPTMRQLPKPILRAIAGKGPKVQDTSGIDAVTRQYVMTPGETFAGIAAQLTGDPARAVELHAANPHWNPERMRLEIPPGWLEWTSLVVPTQSDTGDVVLSPEKDPEKPKSDKPKKAAAAPQGKDGPRPNLTKRVIEVLARDWPENIAIRTGAKAMDPQWFKTLKNVNPHKLVAPNGEFQTLFGGELLNYPDTWPQHIEAKPAPGQGSLPNVPSNGNGGIIPPGMIPPPPQPTIPPGTVPAGATADPASTVRAQGILATFAFKHPEVARPQDYGKIPADMMGTQTERMRSVTSTFQIWWNTRKPPQTLRVDGVIDPATDSALTAYTFEALQEVPIPMNPHPGGGGAPPSNNPNAADPGGKGSNAPGQPPNQGGGPTPEQWSPGIYYNPYLQPIPPEQWSPGIYYNPYLQPVPPPTGQPTHESKSAESSKDDGAAALMVGGTVLSMLLR